MNHHVFVTTADDLKISEPSNISFQTSTYYSPPATSYQTVTTMSFPNEERKDEFILMGSAQDASSSQSSSNSRMHNVKEHPAVVQADQMNAYLGSYFVDQHGASTSTVNDGIDDRLLDDAEARDKKDLEVLLKETDDMADIQHQLNLEHDDLHHFDDDDDDDDDDEGDEGGGGGENGDNLKPKKRQSSAKTRYQNMTENERRIFNHRRRLRQLGLDPEDTNTDMELVRQHVKIANAKKAEAARLRYHRMTPEQKRDYNMRRTEAFRRRRQEEERLLSTPAGRISAEALARAQQIMVRNARKAESARLRYQRMTAEERKQYNMRRAANKNKRKPREPAKNEEMTIADQLRAQAIQQQQMQHMQQQQQQQQQQQREPQHIHQQSSSGGVNGESSSIQQTNVNRSRAHSNGSIYTSEAEMGGGDGASQEQHMLDVINEVAMPTQCDIFAQMEKDVLRRTKQAQMTLQRLHQQQTLNMDNIVIGDLMGHAISQSSSNAIVGGIQYDMAPAIEHEMVVETSSPHEVVSDQHQQMMCEEMIPDNSIDKGHLIDEKALHDMLRTGLDHNGQLVEIRMADGSLISTTEQLNSAIAHGQTILITQQTPPIETKPATLLPGSSNDYNLTVPSNMISYQLDQQQQQQQSQHQSNNQDGSSEDHQFHLGQMSNAEKVALNRAKRAERARLRYHRMSVDQRKEQNARRAEMLRKSRQKDDHLCQLAERMPLEQLDEETRQQIREAQARRLRRAEQARAKYHRMNSEQRRQYNAMRDAQRRQRKREQENRMRQSENPQDLQNNHGDLASHISHSDEHSEASIDIQSVSDTTQSAVESGEMYTEFEMYPGESWEQ